MPVDETKLEYECRACGRTKSTKKQLVQHINSKTDSQHRGRDTDDLIMPKYPSVIPEDSSSTTYNDIVKAFKRIKSGNVEGYGPSIEQEEINHVSELSGWPRDKINRVLKEEKIPHTTTGTNPYVYFDNLPDLQKKILAHLYHDTHDTQTELAEDIGTYKSKISEVKIRKGWLLEDRFRSEEVDDWFEQEEDIDIEKATENLHKAKNNKSENKNEKSNNQTNEDNDSTAKQNEVPSITISGKEDIYKHIKALVLNGEHKQARVIINELIDN